MRLGFSWTIHLDIRPSILVVAFAPHRSLYLSYLYLSCPASLLSTCLAASIMIHHTAFAMQSTLVLNDPRWDGGVQVSAIDSIKPSPPSNESDLMKYLHHPKSEQNQSSWLASDPFHISCHSVNHHPHSRFSDQHLQIEAPSRWITMVQPSRQNSAPRRSF